jgi:hypothetical protein
VDGDSVGTPSLDPADDRPRHARPGGQIRLGHASSQSKRPDPEPETDDIHGDSIGRCDALRRIRRGRETRRSACEDDLAHRAAVS